MGPPRRTNPPKTPNGHQIQQIQQPTPAPATPPLGLGMTTEARYQHNLRVVRRRDPTITSIFDQFDHVCVYTTEDGKWKKAGYEGSMFLFESNTYPPYGIYVLNRSGTADYIQRLYPEDTISVSGTFLAIKSYPEFTVKRTGVIRAQLGDAPFSQPFSDIFAIPNVEELRSDTKGKASITGLWRHEAGNRESMMDVLKRLHSHVVRNEPYPEVFRYGPGHAPPPHRLRAVPKSSDAQTSDSDNGAPSDVDRLFAKLLPKPTPSAPSESQTPSKAPNAVDSLFAKLGSNGATSSAPATPAPGPTGISLLDSIFASAGPSTKAQPVQIYSPTPSTEQQVLNQDVITTLLGLHPSRTPSAASTTRSTTTSRDGDNEEDSESDGGGFLGVPRQIKGDVTPRIPINGRNSFPAPSVIEAASSVATVRPSHSTTPAKPRANRPLVPFEDESELWPYTPNGNGDGGSDDADIVELDFAETSLLSDPEGFTRLKSQGITSDSPGKKVRSRNRKSKKERDAQERTDIENSWDVPEYMTNQRVAHEQRQKMLNSPPASPSPPPSPGVMRTPPPATNGHGKHVSMDVQTPTMGSRVQGAGLNGRGVPTTPSGKGKKVVNGGEGGVVDKDLVESSMLGTIQAQSRGFGKLERNAFVREVLTLIHTDKAFVDELYLRYNSEVA
ncbi:hypothetical protein DFP72DRAFT_612651 [Ephemerocybe angulata]|uniref:Uncharacterized protein n=1 Tax=Ephemerocybe angulata TaxID=980116 RepID=A0A8H6M0D3_9AGAR|nr:hypothetical protein DFP72DRAFT_612651 [Tulosesus angulatus]